MLTGVWRSCGEVVEDVLRCSGFGVYDQVLFLLFVQSDSHSGQHRSSQYSQCRSGDHAVDPDSCRPSNPRHQSAGCCRLAAVSFTKYTLVLHNNFASMLHFVHL